MLFFRKILGLGMKLLTILFCMPFLVACSSSNDSFQMRVSKNNSPHDNFMNDIKTDWELQKRQIQSKRENASAQRDINTYAYNKQLEESLLKPKKGFE